MPIVESTHHAAELQESLPVAEWRSLEVAIAGRILVRRVFGKLAFFSLQDETGTIQLYLDKKRSSQAWQMVIQMLSTTSSTDGCRGHLGVRDNQTDGEGRAICLRAAVRHSYQISSTLT